MAHPQFSVHTHSLLLFSSFSRLPFRLSCHFPSHLTSHISFVLENFLSYFAFLRVTSLLVSQVPRSLKRLVAMKLLKDELLADIKQQGLTKKRPLKVAPLTKRGYKSILLL
jgi:hypothetical protein